MKSPLCHTKLNAPVTVSDETVERVARAMWNCTLTTSQIDEGNAILASGDDWHQYIPEARAAIAALQEAGDE